MVTLYILERFGGLDWGGDEKNILHHGTAEPPTYDLHNVNTKVWFIPVLSGDDYSADLECWIYIIGGTFLGQQWLAVRWEGPHEDYWTGSQKDNHSDGNVQFLPIILRVGTQKHFGQVARIKPLLTIVEKICLSLYMMDLFLFIMITMMPI